MQALTAQLASLEDDVARRKLREEKLASELEVMR